MEGEKYYKNFNKGEVVLSKRNPLGSSRGRGYKDSSLGP